MNNYDELEKILDYKFKNRSILISALTTKSCYMEQIQNKKIVESNERLEHFGDAILKFLTTEYLFFKYLKYDEAQLSNLRQQYESNLFLCDFAIKYKIDKFIIKSKNELINKKIDHTNMNADAIEALVAAIYIDSGKDINIVKKFVFDKIMSILI